jgi:hypothetical protein
MVRIQMAVFTVFELKRGWIQGLGRVYFKEFPSKGEFIKIASEGSWYEVLDVEFATYATSAGDIVLRRAASTAGAWHWSCPTKQRRHTRRTRIAIS